MLAWTGALNEDDVGDFLVRSFAVYAVKNHVFTSSGRVFYDFFLFQILVLHCIIPKVEVFPFSWFTDEPDDDKAWGKRKKDFYDADVEDDDIYSMIYIVYYFM